MINTVSMAKDIMPIYIPERFTEFPMFGDGLSYKITNINGLDPGSADVNIDAYADRPGGSFVGAHQPERNIVIDILLTPKYDLGETVESLRHGIYALASVGFGIELVFTKANGKQYWCEGTVERVDTPLFAEENTLQISVICADPYFYKPTDTELVLDITSNNQEKLVNYGGDTPTGFLFDSSVRSISSLSAVELKVFGPTRPWAARDEQRLYLNGGPFNNGTGVNGFAVNTIRGLKMIYFRQGGVESNALVHYNSPISVWPVLKPGANYFRLNGISGNMNSLTTLYWREKFMGL